MRLRDRAALSLSASVLAVIVGTIVSCSLHKEVLACGFIRVFVHPYQSKAIFRLVPFSENVLVSETSIHIQGFPLRSGGKICELFFCEWLDQIAFGLGSNQHWVS